MMDSSTVGYGQLSLVLANNLGPNAVKVFDGAVDIPGHPAITRRPACELSPDSDLGARPVTTGVGACPGGGVGRVAADPQPGNAGRQRGSGHASSSALCYV